MVGRLQLCEKMLFIKGQYVEACLLQMDQISKVNPKFVPLVEMCIRDSFEASGDIESDNWMLREDRDWANSHHIDFHPAITINDFTYKGEISQVDLTEAICSAYNQRPESCNLGKIWE